MFEGSKLWLLTRLLIGLLLLGTACLKLLSGVNSGYENLPFLKFPIIYKATICWEILLGGLLVIGWNPSASRILSIITFTVFGLVSGSLVLIGQAECNCFGPLKSSPWFSLILDIVVVTVLGLNRLSNPQLNLRTQHRDYRYRLLTGFGVGVFGLIGILFFGTESIQPLLAWIRDEPLEINTSYVDLGTAKIGDFLEGELIIRNWSKRDIRLVGGSSDCSCSTSEGLPQTIPPGQVKR